MKKSIKKVLLFPVAIIVLLLINCSGDDSSNSTAPTPEIIVTGNINVFEETNVLSHSESQNIQISGANLVSDLNISVNQNFEISLNDVNYTNQISIENDEVNGGNITLYVRFSPTESAVGNNFGTISFQSTQASPISINISGVGLSITPIIIVSQANLYFEDTEIGQVSPSISLTINGDNLETEINLTASEGFDISFNDIDFTNNLQINSDSANEQNIVYVRFTPSIANDVSGTLTIENTEAEDVIVNLNGLGTPITHNYITFVDEALGFGGGFNQSANQVFNLHPDLTNISQIKMYLQIDCPSTGCDDWDRFANVKVKDEFDNWFEIGRYITPYWTGTQQLERGLEFDVTDFKSLLTGAVELRIYIENWTAKADLVTIDFDFIEGEPDYPYYAVSEILGYHSNSIAGVPYGVDHNFDLYKQVSIPNNAESTHLRTIISGWGHATPNDSDGRPCAEWCYRTHDVLIDGANVFQHELGPLGCASNPISNQNPGNWQPDRAGWCPGMAVPIRIDEFVTSMAGNTFTFEYNFEDWVNDMGNGNAFYATSTYVVVKSNNIINSPTVFD